jgi:nucleotide-binding universal stress UspA family protein
MNDLKKKPNANRVVVTNGSHTKRIIVAVDLSSHSAKTAAYAAEFAKNVGAAVTLLHVFPPEPSVEFASEQLYESYEQGRRLVAWKLIELVEQVRQTGVKCDHDFRVGDAAEEVARAAQDLHADLIITASHHPGLLRRLLGIDQAPRILHKAHCPVLIYHGEVFA